MKNSQWTFTYFHKGTESNVSYFMHAYHGNLKNSILRKAHMFVLGMKRVYLGAESSSEGTSASVTWSDLAFCILYETPALN